MFNRDSIPLVYFDRPSLVILWNAGCSGCLPAVEDLSQLVTEHGANCYGVAVMVRDVEATAAVAKQSSTKALLGIEARSVHPSSPPGLSRGWVTRHWLEASGQSAVPAAFFVNSVGHIAWIGNPSVFRAALAMMLKGQWDVSAARQDWKSQVTDDDVQKLRITRDVTDALIAGNHDAAFLRMEMAEKQWSAIIKDKEYSALKFDALASDPSRHNAALAHYNEIAAEFRDDLALQIRLARRLVSDMAFSETALRLAVAQLDEWDDEADFEAMPATERQSWILRTLVLAEALSLLGFTDRARDHLEHAAALLNSSIPPRFTDWAATEIQRLRNRLDSH